MTDPPTTLTLPVLLGPVALQARIEGERRHGLQERLGGGRIDPAMHLRDDLALVRSRRRRRGPALPSGRVPRAWPRPARRRRRRCRKWVIAQRSAPQPATRSDGLVPELEVDVGRGRRRDRRVAPDPHAADVADERDPASARAGRTRGGRRGRACRRRASRRASRRRRGRAGAPRAPARPRPTGAACRRRRCAWPRRRGSTGRSGAGRRARGPRPRSRASAPRRRRWRPRGRSGCGSAGSARAPGRRGRPARASCAGLRPGVDEHVAELVAADHPRVAEVQHVDLAVLRHLPEHTIGRWSHRLPEPDRPWMMRTYAGHSTAEKSNELYRSNLAQRPDGPLDRLRPAHADRLRPRPRAGAR